MEWRWRKEFIKSDLRYIKDKLLIYLHFLTNCLLGIYILIRYCVNYRSIYRYIIDIYRCEIRHIKYKLCSDKGCYIELMKLEQYEKEKE